MSGFCIQVKNFLMVIFYKSRVVSAISRERIYRSMSSFVISFTGLSTTRKNFEITLRSVVSVDFLFPLFASIRNCCKNTSLAFMFKEVEAPILTCCVFGVVS